MTAFQAHMSRYRAEHRTLGCNISHMIGVPMILSSFIVLAFHWQAALALFVVGWTLQLVGHRYFEGNRPMLAADPKNPLTYLAAIIFVSQEWACVLRGRRLSDDAPATKRVA